jgi:nucleoside-diphosphate-sugar epimerase
LQTDARAKPARPEVGAVSSAFILGGTGQIGRAAASRLAEAGWDVTVGSRGEREVPSRPRHVRVDRADTAVLEQAVNGVDVLVDVIPFSSADAEQLLALASRVGALIAISSASVYSDEEGRSLDEATGPDELPRLPVPIPESQPTLAPGDATYSTGKAAIERALLERSPAPATVIRPCAVYGRGDRQAREWHFVKRALDRREVVMLAYEGQSRFHTTSSENLGELIRCCADRPGTRALNCGDPDPPTLLEISRAVASAMGHERDEALLPGGPEGVIGRTPWSVPDSHPFIVDMSAAGREVGYRPVTDYRNGVRAACEWLVEATRGKDWRDVLPSRARYYGELFDYAAEDEYAS